MEHRKSLKIQQYKCNQLVFEKEQRQFNAATNDAEQLGIRDARPVNLDRDLMT